jgi:hypothetical protein
LRVTDFHLIQQSLGMSFIGVRQQSLSKLDTLARSMKKGIKQIFVMA